jgi:hypothetical protein
MFWRVECVIRLAMKHGAYATILIFLQVVGLLTVPCALIAGPLGKGNMQNELSILMAGAVLFYISNALYRRIDRS